MSKRFNEVILGIIGLWRERGRRVQVAKSEDKKTAQRYKHTILELSNK